MSLWTNERVNLLKDLWASDMRVRDMIGCFGGLFGRNAIIGKANRIGLPEKGQGRLSRPPVTAQVVVTPAQEEPQRAQPAGFETGLLEVKPSQCRAIVGYDASRYNFAIFCGAPVKEGSNLSFCQYHHSIFTCPPRRR